MQFDRLCSHMLVAHYICIHGVCDCWRECIQHVDHEGWQLCGCMFHSCVLLLLVTIALLGTLLDVRHEHAATMKWDLLYHVSTNVRHLVGSRDGHMMWTTVDESAVSSDPVTADSQTNDEQAAEDGESQGLQRPPSSHLLVEAFSFKPGLIVTTLHCQHIITTVISINNKKTETNLT